MGRSVDVKVTQAGNDSEQLAPAIERIVNPHGTQAAADAGRRRLHQPPKHRGYGGAWRGLGVDYVGSLHKGGDDKD
jgi:hypothetical protein